MSFLNNQWVKGMSARAVGGSGGSNPSGFLPERNNDELRVLRSVLDVVRDNRHVPEIQRSVDLVHKV